MRELIKKNISNKKIELLKIKNLSKINDIENTLKLENLIVKYHLLSNALNDKKIKMSNIVNYIKNLEIEFKYFQHFSSEY